MKYGIKTWNLCAQSQNRSGSMSTQSRTTKPPSRVLLVFEFYLDAMRWFASVWRCSAPFFPFSSIFYFTSLTVNHFTLNILPHWHFCSCCCIGWTLGNCAWQSSLWRYYRASAWLQSSSIFVSLVLVSAFAVYCMRTSGIQMLPRSLAYKWFTPCWPLLLLSVRKTQYWFLFLLIFFL